MDLTSETQWLVLKRHPDYIPAEESDPLWEELGLMDADPRYRSLPPDAARVGKAHGAGLYLLIGPATGYGPQRYVTLLNVVVRNTYEEAEEPEPEYEVPEPVVPGAGPIHADYCAIGTESSEGICTCGATRKHLEETM